MRELTLLFVHGESIGYGRLGVNLAEQLTAKGVDLYDHHEIRSPGGAHLVEDGRRQKLTNTVCWVSVPSHARGWYRGQHAAVFTMWEAMRLPEQFRESLHNFDTVIVPSEQNVDLFSEYHPNVQYVPLGVDPRVWRYVKRSAPENEFVFLCAGSGPRKGNDLVYRAFLEVFKRWPSGMPTPRLVLKSPKGGEFPTPAEFAGRIEIVAGRISQKAEVELYERAHCYVQPARGEGFGLQPLQAIAQGCPTILTNAHGHRAFSWLGIPLDWKPAPSAYFIYGDAGDWWEPDYNQLCEAMYETYMHWELQADRAQLSAEYVSGHLTWRHTAERFLKVLGPHMEVPYSGDSSWFEPDARLYRIITNTDWTADIAGSHYQFQRGREYYELADVKRIMFEAGLLDPRCVNEADPGLAPAQLEERPGYSARYGTCQTCGQPLHHLVQSS